MTELALGTSDGDGSLWKLDYEYGELEANGTVNAAKNTGNIAKQTLSFNGLAQPLVQAYKYDSLYRLTEARETASTNQNWIQTFGYDRFGNRTSFSQNGNGLNSSPTPTIDVNTNRFVTSGQNFVYDKNGNLTTDGENRSFTFNGDNKQTEVKNANGLVVGRYFYDGEGKRVKKKVYEQDGFTVKEETVFVYSAGKLVAEYSTAPAPQNPTTSYTATDQLGSPRVITDANGQVISRRDFMPFGEELNPDSNYRKANDFKYGQTDSVRQRFTGYQKDTETNLDFAEARMYENRHGRFTAVDPLLASGKSANPQTFNRFVYTMNRPLTYTDPTGLQVGLDNKPCASTCRDRIGTIRTNRRGEKSIDFNVEPIATVTISAADESTGEAVDNLTVQTLIGGVNRGFDVITDAGKTAALNTPINVSNFATDYFTIQEIGIPFIVSYRHNLWSNPLRIQPFAYSYQRSQELGSAVEFGFPLAVGFAAGGVVNARVGTPSSLSVAPRTFTTTSVTNPVPTKLARVIPGEGPFPTLGPPGASDVFVTAADDIAGLSAAQISQRLTIQPSKTFTVIEFSTPEWGIASPVFRPDPGFVGFGRTAGGAREFVIPNGPIPAGATIKKVN